MDPSNQQAPEAPLAPSSCKRASRTPGSSLGASARKRRASCGEDHLSFSPQSSDPIRPRVLACGATGALPCLRYPAREKSIAHLSVMVERSLRPAAISSRTCRRIFAFSHIMQGGAQEITRAKLIRDSQVGRDKEPTDEALSLPFDKSGSANRGCAGLCGLSKVQGWALPDWQATVAVRAR